MPRLSNEECHKIWGRNDAAGQGDEPKMDFNEYQRLASRTECDQRKALVRMWAGARQLPPDGMEEAVNSATDEQLRNIRLNHSVAGMVAEVGEASTLLQKVVYHGKPFDEGMRTKLIEEYGDILWYLAEGVSVLGLNLEDVASANVAKLARRYPERYSDWHADRDNRDTEAELQATKEKWLGAVGLSEVVELSEDDRKTLRDAVDSATVLPPATSPHECSECRAIGFPPSASGKGCEFCDGTKGLPRAHPSHKFVQTRCELCGAFATMPSGEQECPVGKDDLVQNRWVPSYDHDLDF